MRSRRIWIGLLALTTAVAAASVALADELLPTERCGDFFLVPIDLRGDEGRRLWMILDTGAESTIVDLSSVKRVTGKSVRTGTRVNIRDATSGPLKIGKLPARAHELRHIAVALGRPIDGILGYNAFRGMILTLDYPGGEVRVGKGSLPAADGREIFALRGKKRPFLPTVVAGEERSLLIDSGSGSSFSIAADDQSWETEPRVVEAYARFKSIDLTEAGRLDGAVDFGPLSFDDPIVNLTEGTQLVGTSVLKHFRLTIDVDGRRMRMVSDVSETLRHDPRRGTGVLASPRKDRLEILQLVPGSPAEQAGLAAGDVIESIEGFDALEQGCERRARLAEGRDSVSYLIRRGGTTFEVEVPLVDLIP